MYPQDFNDFEGSSELGKSLSKASLQVDQAIKSLIAITALFCAGQNP